MKKVVLYFIFMVVLTTVVFAGQLNINYQIVVDNENISFILDGQPTISLPKNTSPLSVNGIFPFSYPDNVTFIPVYNGSCPTLNVTFNVSDLNITCPSPIINTNQTIYINASNGFNLSSGSCSNNTVVYNITYNNTGSCSSTEITSCPTCPAAPACNCNCNQAEFQDSVNSGLSQIVESKVSSVCGNGNLNLSNSAITDVLTRPPEKSLFDTVFENKIWLLALAIAGIFVLVKRDAVLKMLSKKKSNESATSSPHPPLREEDT